MQVKLAGDLTRKSESIIYLLFSKAKRKNRIPAHLI
jgi:hypothetical protein